MTLNYLVHAFMYSYYAIRAAGFKPPRLVSVTITFVQVSSAKQKFYRGHTLCKNLQLISFANSKVYYLSVCL